MVGWMLFLMSLAAFASGSVAKTLPPVSLPRGVVVKPAPGWSSAADVWNVGAGAVSFKRSGVVVVFVADAYSGTSDALLQEQLSQVGAQFDSFRSLAPSNLTIAGDVGAKSLIFSGTAQSGQLEGELVAASRQGTGVAMLAIAPMGQLHALQGDVDEMLSTLVIP